MNPSATSYSSNRQQTPSSNGERRLFCVSKKREDYIINRNRQSAGSTEHSLKRSKSNHMSQIQTLRVHTPRQLRQISLHSAQIETEPPLTTRDSPPNSRNGQFSRGDQYIQMSPSRQISNYLVTNQSKSTSKLQSNYDLNSSLKKQQLNNISLPAFQQTNQLVSPTQITQMTEPNFNDKENTQQQQEKNSRTSSYGNTMNTNFSNTKNLEIHEEEEQCSEIQSLKLTLEMLITREEELIKEIVQRGNKLADIFNLLGGPEDFGFQKENDFSKFREAVLELTMTLNSAAKTETELGTKSREIEKLTIDSRRLQMRNKTISERNQQLQKVIELQQQRIRVLIEENSRLLIRLNTEKKESQVNAKKVVALEKRVEFILENDVNVVLNPNDKLRQSLNELLRENESLKRDLTHKNQEIERTSGNIKRMGDIIGRLNSKIDMLRRNPDGASKQYGGSGEQKETVTKDNIVNANNELLLSSSGKLKKNEDIDLFSNFVIPPSLDFRVVSLKADHQNVISDLIELGNLQFS